MSTVELMPARLSREETEDLKRAIACLEGSTFAQRLTDTIGRPVGALTRGLPVSARRFVALASERALRGALALALRTINPRRPGKSSDRAHKLAAATSGALGGDDSEEVMFERGYFAVRAALAKSVTDSARFVAAQGAAAQSAPVAVRLISPIAARFGLVVSEKIAAQAAPVIGALGGAAVNAVFAEHFQTLARGHFIVRRLEREHGEGLVAFEYQRLRGEAARASDAVGN